MKKIFFFILLFTVCIMIGCEHSASRQAFVYVGYVDEDGFVGNIEGVGSVFVRYENADDRFSLFDTVKVSYDPNDLISQEGSVVMMTGNPAPYTWILEDAVCRKASAWRGEPIFG